MTAVMLLVDRLLPASQRLPAPQEPLLIVQELLRRSGRDAPWNEEEIRRLAWGAHFAYGSACGVAYAWLAGRRGTLQDAPRGAQFGLLVWALSYYGWLPALGILPPPHRRPLGRNLLLLAAHLVWGAVTAEAAQRRQDEP